MKNSTPSQVGLIGLAVMGENLVLNLANNGFQVSVYNRTWDKTEKFLNGRAKEKSIIGFAELKDFVSSIARPRKIIMMVKAGNVVDVFIESLLPFLEKDDILIDGGNSLYTDTSRRVQNCNEKGIQYIGAGISGGEEGALKGPAIMPGGNAKSWQVVAPILQKIAAKVEETPCCQWIGNEGSGHFIKMVHNGIEYGDIQIICEGYHLLKDLIQASNEEMHAIFSRWDQGDLASYLIEITKNILSYKDENKEYTVDKILDTAGQKGTGKWTAIDALSLGIPLTLITESVFARFLSSLKERRVKASEHFSEIQNTSFQDVFKGSKEEFIQKLGNALYATKIISYAQGYELIKEKSEEQDWQLNYGNIALIWRGGCIIRSAFLNDIKEAYSKNPHLEHLFFDDFFKSKLLQTEKDLREIIAIAIRCGIPVPSMAAALAYFDSYRNAKLPANLLQAQRDYFGAHMYERTDKPRGEFFHTNWTGEGGSTASTAYNT